MMFQQAKERTGIAASLLMAAFLLLGATGQRSSARPTWPKQAGALVATSSDGIPAFPRELNGFRTEDGKDFWGKAFSVAGTMRVFQGNGWLLGHGVIFAQGFVTESARRPDPATGYVVLSADRDGSGNDSTNA